MERKNKKIVAGMMAGFCVLSTQTLVQYGLLVGNSSSLQAFGDSDENALKEMNELENKFDNLNIGDEDDDDDENESDASGEEHEKMEMNESEEEFNLLNIGDEDDDDDENNSDASTEEGEEIDKATNMINALNIDDVGILDENNICNGCKYELDDEKEEATLKQCTEDVNEVIIHKYVQGKDGRQYKVTSVDAETLCFSCSSKIQSFKVSEDNQYFKSVDGVLFDKDGKELIYYPEGKEGDTYTMPKGVEYINYWGIQHQYLRFIIIPKGAPCKEELVRVNLGDKIAEVEDGACIYDRCIYSLNDKTQEAELITCIYKNSYYNETIRECEVSIPKYVQGENGKQYEVTSVYSEGLNWFPNLISINADEDNQYFKSVDGVLFSKDGKKLIKYPAGKTGDTYKIPEGVEIICEWAFEGCENLKNIEIPEGVKTIGEYAFAYCDNLEKAILPDSLETIGKRAFEGCKNFKNIEIPEGVKTIGEGAFIDCSDLTTVIILGKETAIEKPAFEICIRLATIYIPEGAQCRKDLEAQGLGDKIVEVEDSACIYDGCIYRLNYEKKEATLERCINTYVTEVRIRKYVQKGDGTKYEVKSVDDQAFAYYWYRKLESFIVDEDNQYFKSVNGVLFSKDGKKLFFWPDGKGDIYTMPEGVEWINYWAFKNQAIRFIIIPKGAPCKEELKRVDLGDKIAEVEDSACIYDGCIYSLNDKTQEAELITCIYKNSYYNETIRECEVSIPKYVQGENGKQYEVTSVYSEGLNWFPNLISINADEDNQYFESVDGVLFSKDGKKLIKYPAGKTGDTYEIPEGVEIICEWAFEGCKNLKNIEIPAGVKTIGEYAFAYCDNLEKAILPDSLETIGKRAFGFCKNFKSIKIPKTVTSMGEFALYGCENLEKVFLPKSLRIIGDNAFDRCELLQHINIPKGAPCKGRLIEMGLGDKIVEVDNIVGENIYK